MPPTRKIFPESVNSPVIARSCSIGLFSAKDSKAEAIVTPAEGPSFGTAPSGTCKWIRVSSKYRLPTFNSRMKRRVYVKDIAEDSLMTSPSCPVIFIDPPPPPPPWPRPSPSSGCFSPESSLSPSFSFATNSMLLLPGALASVLPWPIASMNKEAPPIWVHAKPMTTPGGVPPLYSRSERCGACPTNCVKLSKPMRVISRSSLLRTIFKATLRLIFSNNFFNWRTPASRA
mmetsp:Transcript_104371/g.292445  ORF Transcript_104371/g.292445 Transcript_104371/m.292445 type:complete len:230 (-) Transcript_104371:1647-2336(-)